MCRNGARSAETLCGRCLHGFANQRVVCVTVVRCGCDSGWGRAYLFYRGCHGVLGHVRVTLRVASERRGGGHDAVAALITRLHHLVERVRPEGLHAQPPLLV